MRRIVVEAIIRAPVEIVWKRSQTPEFHTAWDIRFNRISYLDATDERGFHLMEYIYEHCLWNQGQGLRPLPGDAEHSHSSFEFDSSAGNRSFAMGVEYGCIVPARRAHCSKLCTTTMFDTDYSEQCWTGSSFEACCNWQLSGVSRHYVAGVPAMTLRLNAVGHRLKFAIFYLGRRFGMRPRAAEARSWLGSGQVNETVYEKAVMAADAVAGRAT